MTEICNNYFSSTSVAGEKLFSYDIQLNRVMNKACIKSVPCSI